MFGNFTKQNYESIPTSDTDSAQRSERSFSMKKVMIPMAVILLAGYGIAGMSNEAGASLRSLKSLSWFDVKTDPVVSWPEYIHKAGRPKSVFPPTFDIKLPTNTAEAAELGWMKADEACNPKLGEAYLYGGKRSKVTSVTLYFTPVVGDTPGSVAAIEADYYDHVEENLVGTYFSPAAEAEDGTYWSLAVLLRKPTAQGLCDTNDPVPVQEEKYFNIAPELVNYELPMHIDDPKLKKDFKEGMCSPGMGFHYMGDVETGADLTYEAANLIPVTPMYNSQSGNFVGFYFTATDALKRNWPHEKCGGFGAASMGCGMMSSVYEPPAFGQSMWDWVVPIFTQENMSPFFFCNQFCDPNCAWTGAKAFPELGVPASFMSMHFFLAKEGESEVCEGFQDHHYPEKDAHFYCRDKDAYPPYKSCDQDWCA